MMTTGKHLRLGSECPPLKENQLRLYGMRFCPFVRRVRLVLAAKHIPYEEVLVHLSDLPDWYSKKNPVGEVPLLEWIDANTKEIRFIPESLIICNYLDDLYPEHRLHPTDLYTKAKQQVLVDRFGNVLSGFYGIFFGGEPSAVEEFNTSLRTYEEALLGQFFGGSSPAMIDYMLWPWFELLPALVERGYTFNTNGELPKLANWIKAMEASETVKSTRVPVETMLKYVRSHRQGTTDYDVE